MSGIAHDENLNDMGISFSIKYFSTLKTDYLGAHGDAREIFSQWLIQKQQRVICATIDLRIRN